jgi:hypothetical protein
MSQTGRVVPEPWSRGGRWLLLFAFWAWASLAPCLAQQPGLQPLVKLHKTHLLVAGPSPPIRSTDDDVLITAGGDLFSTAVTRNLVPGAHFETTIAQGTSSPAALAALNQALAAGHPARLGGVCVANLVPTGSDFRYQITWFGGHGRTSTFTLTNTGDVPGPPCTHDQIAIAVAILSLEDEILADPATHFTRSSCASDADCARGELCCYPCGIPGCSNVCTPVIAGGRCPALP